LFEAILYVAYTNLIGRTNKRRTKDEQKTNKRRTMNEEMLKRRGR